MKDNNSLKVGIIGAGPAGLATAYELLKISKNLDIFIFDKNDLVGGLARTYKYKNHFFDIGPHRFFTKNEEVLKLWKKVLGKDLVSVKRLTRIMYKNKLFLYPVQLKDVVLKLGILENSQSLLSFIYAKIFLRGMKAVTFEDWITKNFGKKLFNVFFKTYTEKVWGIPCNQIGAEWAAQRIKNLNFVEVVKTAILGQKSRKAKSLVDTFYYPKLGAGQFYQKLSSSIKRNGGQVDLKSEVRKINYKKDQITSVEYKTQGKNLKEDVDFLFSSMPLTHFILCLNPTPPQKIIKAAKSLYYRDHITVNLVIKIKDLFPDNWIYVHSPEVLMARIANYNNFHPKNKHKYTAISVEYFVFQKDELWKKSDWEIIEIAKKELELIKLVKEDDIVDGFVIRETESYPTYYMGHKKSYDLLKEFVEQFTNLQLIGRGGMYKYDNMDHAIYSGILAARNFKEGFKKYDVWAINEDAEYLEEKKK